jgi:hypothetical protein
MTSLEDLYSIRSFDPDLGDQPPTIAAYRDFRRFVTENYGPDALETYYTNWEKGSDV